MRSSLWMTAILLLAWPGVARTDIWDRDSLDDGNGTRNELVHGFVQVHDLEATGATPVADQDWYVIRSRPYSSYEILGEGLTGDLAGNPGLNLDRVDSTAVVLQSSSSLPGGAGFTRSLRWRNDTGTMVTDFARVTATSSCNTACDASDQYTLRFLETTAAVPRFNNSATQTTVLVLQNPTAGTITGTATLFNSVGSLAAQVPFTLAARQTVAINTSLSAPGTSGSIAITHDGRYGDLTGKAETVEPATGFTFDTVLVHGPR